MTEEKQDPPKEKDPIKVSISLPQITGGALAAATAATIGSQLGVAGTILGAMVASIVGGVAGTLYSAGIDRTHRKVSQAILRGYDRLRHDASNNPDEVHQLEAEGTTQPLPGVDVAGAAPSEGVPTQLVPGLDESVFRTGTARTDPAPANGGEQVRRRKPVWTVMALTVGAMFLVALAVITVVELGLGHPLGGGSGTTVGQVVQPRSSAKPTPTPTATVTVTPTLTPTAEPTATTEPTATGTPTEPTASGTPTAATTGTSVPADNAQPSQPAQSVG